MSLTPLCGSEEELSSTEGEDASTSNTSQLRTIDNRELKYFGNVARGKMAQIPLYTWNRQGHSPKKVVKQIILKGSVEARYKSSLKKEMGMLARLKHQNIVDICGIVETNHDFGLVMEYLPFGSCRYFFRTLRDKAQQKLTSLDQFLAPLKIQIIGGVIDGMNYLHRMQPKINLHFDLNSNNVHLDDNFRPKIFELGVSRMASSTLPANATTATLDDIIGTPWYSPPERLRILEANPTQKSDVYSFAIFLWELLTDKIPYEGIDCRQINRLKMFVVDEEGRPDIGCIPNVYPRELIDIMKQAWSQRPEDRQSFKDLQIQMNRLKQDNPEIVRAARDSTQQALALWEEIHGASIAGYERFDTVISESDSPSISEESRCATPIMGQITFPKRHTDEIGTQKRHEILRNSYPDNQEILVPDPIQDENRGSRPSAPFLRNRKCCNIKIAIAMVAALLIFGGGGLLTGFEVTLAGYQCTPLQDIDNGKYECLNGFAVNSVCSFTCNENYLLKGKSAVSCLQNRRWSAPAPTCECPKCSDGFNCRNTLSWELVAITLQEIRENVTQRVRYGEAIFTCSVYVYKNGWSSTCKDENDGTKSKCRYYKSAKEAARHAASDLIRKLVVLGYLPYPCDSHYMDFGCRFDL